MIKRLRQKYFERWLGGYLRQRWRALLAGERPLAGWSGGRRHLMFALCDHYEPRWSAPPQAVAVARVRRWRQEYLSVTAPFRDGDGRGPQHSFFFPGEEYHPDFFDMIDQLVKAGAGEVEIHLHHDGATRETFLRDIRSFIAVLTERGHLARDDRGRPRYAFIHGNWCLANARPDGRWCGVDDELVALFDSGCYADFTFPSAPDVSQPNIVNQIYWPQGDLRARRAYEQGERARLGRRYGDRLLLMEGPLALTRRPGKLSWRIENGGLSGHDPPSAARVHSWVRQNIHVRGRPEWVFVKVHTHGAPEANAEVLLGRAARVMHETLNHHYNDGERWKLHYVTAREMYNIAVAAMDGRRGDPDGQRDYVLGPPPIRRQTQAAAPPLSSGEGGAGAHDGGGDGDQGPQGDGREQGAAA